MNAAQKAHRNYLNSFKPKWRVLPDGTKCQQWSYASPDGTAFNHPNKSIGYGKILYGIATAPVEHRASKKKLNIWLHNPPSHTWGITNYERLRRAKLITTTKKGLQLTALGKKYVAEMHIVD